MIGEGVGDGDDVGPETAMYFTNDWVLTVDFFTVEYTRESLLLLVEVDCRVVLIESEPFPLSQNWHLLSLKRLLELEYFDPVHALSYYWFACFRESINYNSTIINWFEQNQLLKCTD